MPQAFRDIPRPSSSRRNSAPHTIRVKPQSPEQVYVEWQAEPTDPSLTDLTLSGLSWIANKATAAADVLRQTGTAIINQAISSAKDLASTIYAAATGQPPETPGPIFEMATGLAESIARTLPEPVQTKLGLNTESDIAGYITLPDGRSIPVPKYRDPQTTGETALSSSLKATLDRSRIDQQLELARQRLQREQLAASREQWAETFALQEEKAAQEAELRDLQIEAARIALDRMRPTQKELQYWWEQPQPPRPPEPPQKVIRAIGPGIPGGILLDIPKWAL